MSRPQRELELTELLRSLNEHEVAHVVFGAVALSFYGHVRATADLDIVIRPTDGNLRRVHDWLVELDAQLVTNPARRFGPRERWQMFKGQNAAVLTRLGQVDVVQNLPGLPDWDRLIADCERYELDGMTVAVMARATLVELKRRRASGLDLADIEAIQLLETLHD